MRRTTLLGLTLGGLVGTSPALFLRFDLLTRGRFDLTSIFFDANRFLGLYWGSLVSDFILLGAAGYIASRVSARTSSGLIVGAGCPLLSAVIVWGNPVGWLWDVVLVNMIAGFCFGFLGGVLAFRFPPRRKNGGSVPQDST